MKILEVIPSFEPLGGAQNFVFYLAVSMKAKGHDVSIISLYPNVNQYIAESLKSKGIALTYLGKSKGIDIKTSRAFEKAVGKLKPDIVHMHLNTYVTCLPQILKRTEKYIYTFHTYIDGRTYGSKRSLRNRLIKWLIKHNYMHPVTISKAVDDSFKDFFGNCESSIIYNGIDLTKFQYRPKTSIKYDFISVGSFNDIKNNLFMIQCVEKLIQAGKNVQYVILGEGKNYDLCKKYCLEKDLTSNVHLLGKVNNVEQYLSESGCLLLASHWEGNPLVVNEAIASGVWVIANRVGGVIDIVNDTNGYLSKPESQDDFIDKMDLYLASKEDIRKNLIPTTIDENRAKVSLATTSDQYLKLMTKISEAF